MSVIRMLDTRKKPHDGTKIVTRFMSYHLPLCSSRCRDSSSRHSFSLLTSGSSLVAPEEENQCENGRINLNYSQCPEPSNTNFSASRTTTHQMPQSCTIIPLLTSPLWKKRETFFQCHISAADIPRDSRIRSCRTAIEFFNQVPTDASSNILPSILNCEV